MKKVKHIFIIIGIIIISFLLNRCSAYQTANAEFEKGNYEVALSYYLKDFKAHPDRIESRDKIKIIAEKLVPEKIEKGNAYLASDNYHSAWDFIKSACSIIAQVESVGISFQSEQQYRESCRQAKEGIAQGLYINATRLMDIKDYRTAYEEFRIIKDIFPTGYKDVDQLMAESLRKGQVRIVIVMRPYYNRSIENRIYNEIKEKIIKKSSPFLTVVEPYMPDWDVIGRNSSIYTNLNENKLDGMVILSIAEYKIIPETSRESIKLCYIVQDEAGPAGPTGPAGPGLPDKPHPVSRSSFQSSGSYIGIPVNAYEYTYEKTLRLGVSYEFINAESGKITLIDTARKEYYDKVTFTKFANLNDSLKDKDSFALNCPRPGKLFEPQWYDPENFEKKDLTSDEGMLSTVLPFVSDKVANAVLGTFDKQYK